MDWKSVSEKIGQDDQQKWDRKVSGKDPLVTDNGALRLMNCHAEAPEHPLSDTATLQMCQKLKKPVRYYRRLAGHMRAVVANHDIGRLNGNGFLLRGVRASG